MTDFEKWWELRKARSQGMYDATSLSLDAYLAGQASADKEMLRLIESIKYLRGIAERGTGNECPPDVTIEKFVLGYVQELERERDGKEVEVQHLAGKLLLVEAEFKALEVERDSLREQLKSETASSKDLQASLKAQVGGPYVWAILWDDDDGHYAWRFSEPKDIPNGKHAIPLYTHPTTERRVIKDELRDDAVGVFGKESDAADKELFDLLLKTTTERRVPEDALNAAPKGEV